jgi:hypothetical protein
MGLLLGHQPKRYWRRALADSGRQLVSQVPVDSGRIWAWDRCHWKLYEILLPTIYRTSKTDSLCDLSVRFIAHCSWTSNWTRTWIAFGLHLGDSNRINLGPPCWLGNPCWTFSTPFHAPIMVVCMGVMSSSLCATIQRNPYSAKLLRRATNTSMLEWCTFAPTKLCGSQRNLCGALHTILPTTTKHGHNWRVCCEKHAKRRNHPIQRGSTWWRQCKCCLWAWASSPSTSGSIRWRGCPNLLWARVKLPRSSIPTTDRRLRRRSFSFLFFSLFL